LAPSSKHHQDEDVARVYFSINDALRPPTGGCERIFPSKWLEGDTLPSSEAFIQVVDYFLECPPLDGEVVRGRDEDLDCAAS
jgi:hypothetical protein